MNLIMIHIWLDCYSDGSYGDAVRSGGVFDGVRIPHLTATIIVFLNLVDGRRLQPEYLNIMAILKYLEILKVL